MTQDERKALHQQWREHIETWQQSGLTQVAFCHQAGISKHQLSYWRKLFSDQTPKSKLIPINAAPPRFSSQSCVSAMLPSGIRLEIPAELAVQLLPTLLVVRDEGR